MKLTTAFNCSFVYAQRPLGKITQILPPSPTSSLAPLSWPADPTCLRPPPLSKQCWRKKQSEGERRQYTYQSTHVVTCNYLDLIPTRTCSVSNVNVTCVLNSLLALAAHTHTVTVIRAQARANPTEDLPFGHYYVTLTLV
ncbi:hypothetical protein, unlikely [Trypanosoma brucei gambiense DAL972]|uniref:Uncharacterized protein n=1 Tax=Trypanosoma brucei gambiense (strain MHOM/CI/86/DAL972) TaxID=679716 RepID=D0A4S9_TRYB9|nr:hypothetical protein, unlikely [Trypanosoma brucei gambiense DAL972]CBH16273.1 hypothetical protein, unlikely [Trypanosoma brucei gambiense DAL972]|eukprot:XP_011778537.1 hypothetical protein, unlikely [Trypanosoma brucei gambiense DAL972]